MYSCRGLTAADAEAAYLTVAKTLELYGVDMHMVMVSNWRKAGLQKK